MRLLLRVQYQSILFPKGANITELISSFNGLKLVEEEGPWDCKKWKVRGSPDIEIKLINDDDTTLPENNEDDGKYEAFAKLSKERDELRSKNYSLEKQLKDIKKTMGISDKEEAEA